MSTLLATPVTVIGLGAMGRGIARAFAGHGARVTVVDADPEATRDGHRQTLDEAAGDGEPVELTAAPDLATAVAGAALVIEAVVEDMAAKKDLLATVSGAAPAEAVVATNTSSLSIGEMARALEAPHRFVGMHFFNPPTRMRLVELVRGAHTDDRTVALAGEWVRAVGKTPVVCGDSPNFVVNRICRPLYYEAQLLVTQGVEPATVDAVARCALGHRMGPLQLLDFTGLHTHLASSETALREFGEPRYRPVPLTRRLVRSGLTGRAAGRGFYDYTAEKPRAAFDRVVRTSQEAPAGTIHLAGPGTEALLGNERLRTARDGAAETVLYSAPVALTDDDLAAVVRLRDSGRRVVVDSSDGRLIEDLPTGVEWLRLHARQDEPAAEVVEDTEAAIAPGAGVAAVARAVGAVTIAVPALPGLIADRLQHCLVNEAVLLVEEGNASPADVDTALRLGMNHPVGPFEYLNEQGAGLVYRGVCQLLDGFGDARYRPCQLLRRRAAGQRRQ
ncbi:3-hydroxyacyl-CoA dehydrogenase [Salinactinospora qingdaonensis]|uniref:3-hydroxybutyryl-CoA dehydrogenase n=1 Tax=Salinactinospora qingdaonensis TaxID=702744 RepID=A0ABP7FAN6_9ACTN